MKNHLSNMKGLIIGCGSIGQRHLHNLKKIGIKNIAICDKDKKRVNELSKKYNTPKFYDLNSALSFEPDFSVICTYPNSHLQIASACIDMNSHIFIEKPISSDLRGIEMMLKRAHVKRLQVAVGYNLRFDPGLCLLKKKLMKSEISKVLSIFSQWGHNIKLWRPGTDYKNHYVLKKGSGIILDDSHEYDYIRWLLNDDVESIYCQTRKITSIKTETESLAAIILKFKKGIIANLVIDYVRPKYERTCQIIGEKGDMKWEYAVKEKNWKNYGVLANSTVTTSFVGSKSALRKNFVVKSNEMYVNEIKNFIHSVTENEKPLVDGWEGFKTLRIGMAALQSAKRNKIIRL